MNDDTNELFDRVIRVKRRRRRSRSTSSSEKYHHRKIKKHSVLTVALDYMHWRLGGVSNREIDFGFGRGAVRACVRSCVRA